MNEEIKEIEHESVPESETEKKSTNVIAQLLLNFSRTERNKRLNELIYDLVKFKKFYRQNLEKIHLETQTNLTSLYNTEIVIYNSLEKNMIEISCITNKEIRTNRINNLYLWYKEKLKINEDLRQINMKSYKEKDEIGDEDLKEWAGYDEQEETQEKIKENNFDEKIDPHRNQEIFNKNIFNDYKRKVISKSLEDILNKNQPTERNETNNDISVKDNADLAKTLMSLRNREFSAGGNYSTFYSNKYGTNTFSLGKFRQTDNEFTSFRDTAKGGDHENNFYPNYNKSSKVYFPLLSRETKFSYSYNRPEYNYGNMIYENSVMKNKMRLLADKRSKEEIKAQIEKLGKIRAKYKESINNKYEMRKVINMYVKTNDFSSPILQKYKLKYSKSTNDIHGNSRNVKRDNLYKKTNAETQEFNVGVSNITQQTNKNIITGEDNFNTPIKEEEIDKAQNEFSTSPKNEDNATKEKDKKPKKILKENKLISDLMRKIKTDSIKNIENKKILEPLKLNKIKIKIKLHKDKVQNNMLTNMIKTEKPPSDVISNLMTSDTLIHANQTYQSLCNLNRKIKQSETKNNDEKESDNESKEEDDSFYHNFCLSMYDVGNLKKINNQNRNNKNQNINNHPHTIRHESKLKYEKLHKTYNLYKNNLLNLRRTVSDWKKGECLLLLNKLESKKTPKNEKEKKEEKRDEDNKKKYLKRQNSVLNAIINPKDNSDYAQYFLPRTGRLLLKKVEEVKIKKVEEN